MRPLPRLVLACLLAASVPPAASLAAEGEEPAAALRPSLDARGRNGVLHTLREAGMEARDLGFEKKAGPRPLCLPVVEEGLDYPLRVPAQADDLAAGLAVPGAAEALLAAASPLPEGGGWRRGALAGGPSSFPGEPPSLARLYDAWRAAASALPEVTSEDWEFLLGRGEAVAFRQDRDGPSPTAEETDRFLREGERLGPGRAPLEVRELLAACEAVVADADAWRRRGPGTLERPEDAPGPTPRVVITGATEDIINATLVEADVVVDLGGSDTWMGPWASGVGRVQVVIDLGGNDRYEAPEFDYVQGAGVCGVGILVDAGGSDLYRARHASQGAGLLGCGVLLDLGGDDLYEGDTLVQGAGVFGVGLLRDGDGRDGYRAALFAQGFGRTRGVGVLQDRGGNDAYHAGGRYPDSPDRWGEGNTLSLSQGFGHGLRPMEGEEGAAGGIGVLLDEGAGADAYTVDLFGQGASYWYSLGVLVDGGGNDTYTAQQYAQGSGIHLSVGVLVDRGGMDRYQSVACCQGQGHDLAVGWLLDLGGDDLYAAKDLCQGAGSANGVGIHLDASGDDGYLARSADRGQPYGNPRRGWGSIGVLCDLAGRDTYSGPLRDGESWTGSTWATARDYAAGEEPPDPGPVDETPVRDPRTGLPPEPPSPPPPPDPAPGTREAEVLELFRRATVRDRRLAEDRNAALEALVRHPAALEFLAGRLDLWNRFVRNDGVFPAVAKGAGAAAVPILAAALEREPIALRRRVLLEMLGATGSPAARPFLVRSLADPDPALRAEAVRALARFGAGRGIVYAVTGRLEDPDSGVRIAALNAMREIGERAATAAPALEEALASPDFRVRFLAASALAAAGQRDVLRRVAEEGEFPASAAARRALEEPGR